MARILTCLKALRCFSSWTKAKKAFIDSLPVYPPSINSTRTWTWSQLKLSRVRVRSDYLPNLLNEIKTMFFLMSSLCADKYILVHICAGSSCCFHLHTVLLISKFAQLSMCNDNRVFFFCRFFFPQRSVHNTHLVFSQFGLWLWSVRAPLGAGLVVCWGPLTSLPQNNKNEKLPSVSKVVCRCLFVSVEQETYMISHTAVRHPLQRRWC